MTAGYAVVAWITAQVADLAVDNFGAPSWFMPMLLTVLALGLPIAVALAWAFETTPEGVRRTDVPTGAPIVSLHGRLLLGAILATLLAMAVTFPIWRPRADEPGVEAGVPGGVVERAAAQR